MKNIFENIFEFCKTLNFEPTPRQAELFALVQRGCPRIAVKAGNGTGKTTASVVSCLWQVLRNPGSRGLVVTPTMGMYRDIWLREAKEILRKSDPSLKKQIVVDDLKIIFAGKGDWGIRRLRAEKGEDVMGFVGNHFSIVFDEAAWLSRDMLKIFEDVFSTSNSTFLMLGCLHNRDSAFFDCFGSLKIRWDTLTWGGDVY